mmetsp:Transcript_18934/g.24085  ORF Transcript_18934/g.24085 Transcript_18934/m.24085 type:complete len:331 (-) Transcript_18934:34-1026(-)
MANMIRSRLLTCNRNRWTAVGMVGGVGSFIDWTQPTTTDVVFCEEKEPTISSLLEQNEKNATSKILATSNAEPPTYSLLQQMAAEAIGTGIIVSGGCGAVCASKFGGTPLSLMHIATAFGVSVALAVYATRDVSGAHLNPAVTASLAWHHPESCPNPLQYMVAQFGGATIAGGINYAMYSKGIDALHIAEKVSRGTTAASSGLFNGAFHMIPNNALVKTLGGALAVEVGLTTGLAFGIYALTDPAKSVPAGAQPALVGATVAALVVPGAPLTGCGMNPARDLGPRLIAATLGGLGKAALHPSWWVYSIGPVIGAIAGGYVYQAALTVAEK